ncbi:MAG: 23S rRNA (pseudouridine(1915)-N(3))-methyltransferase RlmH [Myxococcales bacterium]|nr:23S rRNA (pseudouridine(1915)-N(3))-methyltransferase RlmH [Myxococcales bacterium]
MIRCTLATVGKIRDKNLARLSQEFEKRVSRYAQLRVVETPDIPPKSDGSHIDRWSSNLLAAAPNGSLIVALDEGGEVWSSEQFSSWLQERALRGQSDFAFLIGGADGLGDVSRKAANQVLSLSRMTFTHEMARVFFLEQLYRAMTIWRGEPYHR